MSTNRVIHRTEEGPAFEYDIIPWIADMGPGESLKKLTANETITDAQRRWYKGHVLPVLSKNDENGESVDFWDTRVKQLCNGLAHLKKDTFYIEDTTGGMVPFGRLTTKGVGVRKMTAFIEEILAKAVQYGWPLGPPDPTLRK